MQSDMQIPKALKVRLFVQMSDEQWKQQVVDGVAGEPRVQFFHAYGRYGSGIDTAGERKGQRHVGAQPDLYGVAKNFFVLGHEIGERPTRLL